MNLNLNISNNQHSIPISEDYNNNSNNYNFSIVNNSKLDKDNFPKEFSRNSEDIRKYYEISDKDRTTSDKKDIYSNISNIVEQSNNNTFEGIYNKTLYDSQNRTNEKNSKIMNNKHSIFSNEGTNFSLNNSNSIIKNKIMPSKLITHYKNWKGDNYFPLKAYIIEGPCSFRPTLMTGSAMTIPTLLFIIFNSDYITDKITIFIPVIIALIYLIAFIYLIIASFCDPGIIRRYIIINDDIKKDKNNNDITNIKRNESKIFHLGYLMNYKYCPSCGIIRPNRSTHCSDCNNCVERLDHHCPWIGNCAGKRNYKYFFIFLVLLNILAILLIVFCVIYIVKKVQDYKDINDKLSKEKKIEHLTALSLCESIISLYLIIYCILTMCFITGLLFYHIKLIISNSTTKEKLRNVFSNKQGNPYKRNTCTNIKNVLCPKIKKYSILDILRGNIKEICDSKKHKSSIKSNPNNTKNIIINETKAKFNIKSLINKNPVNDSIYKTEDKYISNTNSDNTIYGLMNTNISNRINNNINSNFMGVKEYYNNTNDYINNNTIIKEPLDTEIDIESTNPKTKNIKKNYLNDKNKKVKNYKLEEYLKNLGTGKPSILKNNYK